MSPPLIHPNDRYSPNMLLDDRSRYRDRFSPDSRFNDDPMYPYDTENDFSPPRSPEPRYYRDRHRDDDYYSPPPSPDNRKKMHMNKGSSSSSDCSLNL